MIIGYARVSTQDQQTLRQIDQLKDFGCERIYEEKDAIASCSLRMNSIARPQG